MPDSDNWAWGHQGRGDPLRASFDSRCPSCQTPIYKGDIIEQSTDGIYVHERCRDGFVPIRKAKVQSPGVCPSCFLELPLTGVCGNC